MWRDPLLVACTVCFGAADGPLLTAARVGVLVMVAVTSGVLVGFGAFFLRVARKGDSPLFADLRKPKKGDSPLFDNRGKGDSPLFPGAA